MNAEEIKSKAAEAMSNAKERVETIASDKRVQSAKASLLKYISNAKAWVVSNWNIPGWRGKAKVAAALLVAFFFCRGVFCGWGTSRLEKEEAAAHLFGALLGGGNDGLQQDSMSIWTCNHCGRQIQSVNSPSSSIRCPSGASKHCWFVKSN